MDNRRVEIYVQDFFQESSPKKSVENGDKYVPISAETWSSWFYQWVNIMECDIIPPAYLYEIGLRLTDDREIQTLNFQYRNQDKSTDVLAFAAREVDLPKFTQIETSEPLYLGDIVISVDTAQKQAIQQGHSLKTELAWLASHGLLHLIGWDHPDEESLQRMMIKQVLLLKTVSIDIHIE